MIRRLNFSSSVYLTKSDGYTIIFPVKYKGCDEDRTGLCAVQRVGNGGTPRGGFQISHHFRAEISKLMRVDFSVQATSVHRTCLSPKEVRENVQFEWYRG